MNSQGIVLKDRKSRLLHAYSAPSWRVLDQQPCGAPRWRLALPGQLKVSPADQRHSSSDRTSFSMGELARKHRATQDQEQMIPVELVLNNWSWASNNIQWQIINITKVTHFRAISYLQYKELPWLSQIFDPLMTAERASGQKIITVCQTVWHSTFHMVQQTVSKIWPQGGLKHIIRKYSSKWSTEHPTADQCLKWAILSSWNVFD